MCQESQSGVSDSAHLAAVLGNDRQRFLCMYVYSTVTLGVKLTPVRTVNSFIKSKDRLEQDGELSSKHVMVVHLGVGLGII